VARLFLDNRVGIKAVNEIEFIDGSLYMNRWFTNDIYKVDPKTGYVLNKIDFSALHERSLILHKKKLGRGFDGDDVFNGIAYDRDRKTWFLTGKNWQKIFEVRMEQEMQFAKP
jgi:glutamine cyclotransferase